MGANIFSCLITRPEPATVKTVNTATNTSGTESLGGASLQVYCTKTRAWVPQDCESGIDGGDGANVCWDAWGGNDGGASVCSGVGDGSVCGVGDTGVGLGGDGAYWDGVGALGTDVVNAFSADGALGDTGGDGAGAGTNAVGADAQWDGLCLNCLLEKGKLPTPFKADIRKMLGNKHSELTNPLLKAIDSGNIRLNAIKDTLLVAWCNPETPAVLMCLIADIFHKHNCEKELGELPTYYIPLQKQNHQHPQKVKEPKIGEFVVCNICQNRRGECKCCTACYNRNGECSCGKQCTVVHHKCCICTGCCNNMCNCTCRVLEFLSLWSL